MGLEQVSPFDCRPGGGVDGERRQFVVLDSPPDGDGCRPRSAASGGGADGLGGVREFVAAATHDLRGVQAGLATAVNLLRMATDDPARESLLSILERQTARLRRLTDDLFVLSMADTGRLECRPGRVELEPVLRDAALESGGEVEVVNPAGWWVWADAAHVQRIVSNLIRNAFRHGAPPVRITTSAHLGQVEIRVSDAGPGVPDQFVPRLFGRFTRVGSADPGAGLGLSIVAELAGLNGGSAHYEAHPPGRPGATFVVCLPQSAPSLPARQRFQLNTERFSAAQARLASAMASNREVTTRRRAVLDTASVTRAWSEGLRREARQRIRDRRRLLSEGSALTNRTAEFDRAIHHLMAQDS